MKLILEISSRKYILFKHESVLNRDQGGICPNNGLHYDPLLPSISTDILHTVPYGNAEGNLLNNQELHNLVIISHVSHVWFSSNTVRRS